MGRPRKSEPRDRQLNLSLTASEYESIVERAAELGVRPVHLGRTLLFSEQKNAARMRERADALSNAIAAQLSRIGNNLNQLVRRCHQNGDDALPPDLEPLLNDIRSLIVRIRL